MATQLSKHTIAATLASLATTGAIACGGAQQPADAPVATDEVAPAAAAAPEDGTVTVDEASATEVIEVQMPADQNADVVPGDGGAVPTDAKPADDAKPAGDAKEPAQDKKSPPEAVEPKKGAKKKATEGDGGCGAGTCG